MMDQDQLQRLMRLARKTKNPLIMTDPEGRAPMVLMDIDQYETLIDAESFISENRQGALPVTVEESQFGTNLPFEVDEEDDIEDDEGEEAWSLDDLPEEFFTEPPLESIGVTTQEEDLVPVKETGAEETQSLEPTIEPIEQQEAQENQGKNDDEDPGEEQFYLEPIE